MGNNDGMWMAGAMGVGMFATGYFGAKSDSRMAEMYENVATERYETMESIATSNNQTQLRLARREFNFMDAQGRREFRLANREIRAMERQDGLNYLMFKDALASRMEETTRYYSAANQAEMDSHEQVMTGMKYALIGHLADLKAQQNQPLEIDMADLYQKI